jgi:hypothetical protein
MSESAIIGATRTNYTISWEEFLEMFENSLPRPNLIAVTVTLGCATVFGIFCVLLARSVDHEDWGVVSIFWALPVLLVAFAFWELTFGVAQTRKKQLKKLRSVYQRSFSKEQAFSFGSERWIHDTDGSKQEISWNNVLTVSEWPSIVTLSSQNYVAVVPRRVLGTSDLALIRANAFGNAGLKLSVRNSFVDWAYTTLIQLWKGNVWPMLTIHAGAVVALVWMVRRLGRPSNPTDFFWGEVLCLVVLIAGFTAQFWYLPLKYWSMGVETKSPMEVQVYDRGIWFKRLKVEFFRAWSSFNKSEEDRRSFLLFYREGSSFVLGKTDLTRDQVDEFRRLAEVRIETL